MLILYKYKIGTKVEANNSYRLSAWYFDTVTQNKDQEIFILIFSS